MQKNKNSMKITGRVTFRDCSVKNSVTIEGARTIIGSLMNNSMGFITNILFVTDADNFSKLQTAYQNDKHKVTWDMLYNGGSPLYDVDNPLGLTSSSEDKEGTIVLSDSGELDSVISLDINAYIEEGILKSDGLSVYAMAVILNGSGQRMTDGAYSPTGNERVLCFIDTITQLFKNVDNEFRWTLYFDVSQ